MKYGFNLLLWTSDVDDSTPDLVGQVKEYGYDGVELPIFAFDTAPYAKVGETLREHGMGCSAVTVCTEEENPISEDPAIRQAGLDRLKRAIDCCEAAGATHLCGPLHSALGHFPGHGRTEDEWGRAKDILAQAADHAKQANVTLAVEYLNRFECYFLNCAADTHRFCTEVGHSHLKMMYDTFHANIEEKDPVGVITEFADQIVHVHISENDRSTPGQGNVPWEPTFAALKESGYTNTDGWMTIEAFGLALPDLAAATKIWRKMYESEQQLAVDGLKFMKAHT